MSLQTELRENNLRRAAVAVGTGLLTFGVTATLTYGYLELRQYQEQRAQWDQIRSLVQAQDYEGCLAAVPRMSSESRYFEAAQPLLYQCRLGQAQVQAEGEDWSGAIAAAALIPQSNEKFYGEAQPLIETWSKNITQKGEKLLAIGKLDEAIETLRAIPESSPTFSQTQRTIQQWQGNWEKNETVLAETDALLERGQWLAAQQNLEKLEKNPFWTQKAKPLLEKAEAGIIAVTEYEAGLSRPQTAVAAAPQEIYIPPIQETAPAPGGAAPVAPPLPAAAPPPVAVAPAPIADPSVGFNQGVESLYETYRSQGQATMDAWTQACRDSGGQIIDQGPESACLP